jgi:hypothetical protein
MSAGPHQHLLAAVDHEEVRETPNLEDGKPGDEGRDAASASVLRTLGLGETGDPMIRTTRAV